ncbi:MAG: Gfo/Idh/MocA family protein [Sedimentitalea sp.]
MIKVAILGAGIGAEHLAGYRACADLFDVRLLCDRDQARAGAIFDGVICADIETALGADVDVIDICLPPHLHVPVALQALAAGKHVICEKPIAGSLTDCDRLEAAARHADRQVFPVFQYRFGSATAQLQALIQAGVAGAPLGGALQTHWNRGADYYGVPWRGTWAGEGGGAILGHAIHSHDLICHLFGPVAQVQAALATRVNPIETEDSAALIFQHENGALVTSSVSLGAAQDTSQLTLMFEKLTAQSGTAPYAPMASGWTFTARAPAEQGDIDAVLDDVAPTPAGFAGFLTAVANALRGVPGAVTLADGRASSELVSALYAADRRGATVALPLAQNDPIYAGWLPDLQET